jgi:hypothetical protein
MGCEGALLQGVWSLMEMVCSRSRFIGVTDLASVRFSLPSQLLEPTPNLEYWNYLDSPNAFVAIGTADEPLDRMLEVLRFWFTKDLKYAKGKPVKPYNSCLGEFFRVRTSPFRAGVPFRLGRVATRALADPLLVSKQCNWDTEDNAPRIDSQALAGLGASGSIGSASSSPPGSSASSFKSARLNVPNVPNGPNGPNGLGAGGSRGASTVSIQQADATREDATTQKVRVSYLTEQTSHHPPVSAFYISCPDKGLYARGYDQISAKFTGTSIKVMPGEHNLGIFVTVERRNNETYQLTHPAAHLGGILRGALSVSVGDMAYITSPQTKLKAILNYYDEGWLGRSVNKVEGVIFRYDPENDDRMRIRDVPEAEVLARLTGPWKEKIVFTLGPKPVVSIFVNFVTRLISLAPPRACLPAALALPLRAYCFC